MIRGLSKDHIERALQQIDSEGVPPGRDSRKYSLIANGRKYPPKYVLSLAAFYAYGRKLRSYEFSGGIETNKLLEKLGFTIEDQSGKQFHSVPVKHRPTKSHGHIGESHDERCPFCKDTVFQMLKTIYGEVEKNYHLEAGILPEHYSSSQWHPELQAIYNALASHRGFEQFVRAPSLPNCDFYVPKPGFIVEFDESQHFTECRQLTLERYSAFLPIGYDLEDWITHCKTLKMRDNDPPYRDEQRAWYDTLRDFLPSLKGCLPTVRLYSRELKWCNLQPTVQTDVDFFRERIERHRTGIEPGRIQIKGDHRAVIGRVIIVGSWPGEVKSASELLYQISELWPSDAKVEFLMTPGAFVRFGNPNDLPYVQDNMRPNPEIVDKLFGQARSQCDAVMTDTLRDRLKKCTRYLTLGVDSRKSRISQTQHFINESHVEMVCLLDLQTGHYHVTGKSYPTPQQQGRLLRIPDLASHFCDLECGSTMVLGCHDLTIFNPRAQAVARGWRSNVNREFRRLAKERKPKFVLHHPHTTIKTTTWIHAWNELLKELPSVQTYAGNGRYSSDDAGWAKRHSLDDILEKTASCPTLDLIVKT
jgi:hypothetical protein